MALFESDFIALIFLAVIGVGLYLTNKILSLFLNKAPSVSVATRIKVTFVFRIVSFAILIYLIIEGFPIFEQIPPTYTAILTGSISTALAFASSGIFSNLVSGLALISIRPFEVGDVVKINQDLGVVRSIRLTKVVIETFDNIKVVKSNSEIISSTIINHSANLGRIRKFVNFKDKIHYAENLFPSMLEEEEEDENLLRELFTTFFKKNKNQKVHNYIWTMEIPYLGLFNRLDKIETVCKEYRKKFGFKPRYHIFKVGRDITLKFRIMTLKTRNIFDFQPRFANEMYKIIHEYVEV
ncbi:MAG: mechanosensitive ion channel [Candidatus Lokiarchaeota archaeon]|nr:mechanosensitive ion channel [Candidatus Lokiarchaeota archaeon]